MCSNLQFLAIITKIKGHGGRVNEVHEKENKWAADVRFDIKTLRMVHLGGWAFGNILFGKFGIFGCHNYKSELP